MLLLFFTCAFSVIEWGTVSVEEELKNQRQIELELADE
jgi:hypothetical protein